MRILLNGQPHASPDPCSLAQLLAQIGVEPRRVAVERNEQLVRRAEYERTDLQDGDRIEVVTLVGGG